MEESSYAQARDRKVPVQSVARALGILECFYDHSSLRLVELSQMTGLNKSTTFGLVRSLEEMGFLRQDKDTGKYQLGTAIFRLGNNVESSLRSLAKISLGILVGKFGETANLSVRSGDNNMYLEKLESPFSMRISTSLGQTFPLYLTAMGKCILAYLPETEVDDILSRVRFVRYTQNSLMSAEAVKRDLMFVRERGYSVDNEERERGLICIAVPVFNRSDEVVASLSVSGPSPRMPENKLMEIQDTLKQEALRIRASL